MIETQKEVCLKNNETILLTITQDVDDIDFFTICAKNLAQNKIGYATFKIKKKSCYLFKIEITNQKYAHKGLGSKMLNFMEEFATSRRCDWIDGKFYPFGDNGKYAKDFYLKNNYIIEKDGYETLISKSLQRYHSKSV